jgi:hypothetical protein
MVAFFAPFVRYPSFFGSSQKGEKMYDNKGLKGVWFVFWLVFLTKKQQKHIKTMA